MRRCVIFPWPDKRLSPNARVHRMQLYGLRKKAFDAAALATVSQLSQAQRAGIGANGGPVAVAMRFYPPCRRKRDIDNMLSASKALLDGFAYGIGVDDSRFELTLIRCEPAPPGRVEVEV